MVKLIFNSNADEEFDNTDNAWEYYKKKYKIVNGTALDIQGKIIEVSESWLSCIIVFSLANLTNWRKKLKLLSPDSSFCMKT